MKLTLREWFVSLLIVVVTLLVAWVFWPRGTKLGNESYNTSNQRVVIIPSGSIPLGFLRNLERALEEQHGFNVLISPEMGLDAKWRIPETQQYNASLLAQQGLTLLRNMDRANAFCIILTNEDINDPDSGLRFLFSAHFEGVSVVSLARLNPESFGPVKKDVLSLPFLFNTLTDRTLKVINKAVGLGLYGYTQSSDTNSVMYGPIMGVSDLDRIGRWYQKQ
jgi:predicted Zn-dependent protease